jgi:hypothetical protein
MDIMNVRTWVFFYLICFVALLWAIFLLARGMMLWVGLTLVIIVVGFNFILLASEIKHNKKREHLMKNISSHITKLKEEKEDGE